MNKAFAFLRIARRVLGAKLLSINTHFLAKNKEERSQWVYLGTEYIPSF
jgi:hypothetical protein